MKGIRTITIEENDYPSSLKQIPNPPKILYYRGTIKKYEPLISIVGTRKCSSYGRQITFDIAGKLSDAGFVVVSGLAPGIDTFAHTSAVKRNKRTIAVLGTGLDEEFIYPKENIELSRKIVENGGCLISEYPPQTKAASFTFPRRNRIIAGLSPATLVIESNQTGGAMITASYALSYKRKLFAVPGDIYSPTSAGPHKLIKYGAKLIDNANEIIKELNLPNFHFSPITKKTD
jgi:DNA processing protein